MALSINTNVTSLQIGRTLNDSSNRLNTTMERLSTGSRINSAKDDAAGLQITERMSAQIRGLNQGSRNANDAISLAQTAESDLGNITETLQRVRELGVQSSNASNSQGDRDALQREVKQLMNEISRVAETSSFNGVNLLDGSFSGQAFQVGANSGDLIYVTDIADASTSTLGGSVLVETNSSAIALATGELIDGDKVTYTALALTVAGADTSIATAQLSTIGADLGYTTGDSLTAGQVSELFELTFAAAGMVAEASVEFTPANVAASAAATMEVDISYGDTIANKTDAAGGVSNIAITSDQFTNVAAGDLDATDINRLNQLDISSRVGAQLAIDEAQLAMDDLNEARGSLGAIQTRFETAVSSSASQAENISDARGRIKDTDFAMETTQLAKEQILQQAGTAMLAQANQLGQTVLSLLG